VASLVASLLGGAAKLVAAAKQDLFSARALATHEMGAQSWQTARGETQFVQINGFHVHLPGRVH